MWFKWKDIEVNYKIVGEGKPILMIHGYMPDHELMFGAMEPIFESSSHYKRIYLDLPGMGLSSSSESIRNSDDMLAALETFAKSIIGEESFLVAGESYGGYLARGLIKHMSAQIEGALFICPMIVANSENRDLPRREVILRDPELLEHLTVEEREMYESIAVVQDEQTWHHFKKYVIPGLIKANTVFLERIRTEGYTFSFDLDQPSYRFEKPVLFLTGRQDTSVGYKDAWHIMDQYPRGTYVTLDRAGHSLESEQSVLLGALVKEWLFRCEEATTHI